MKFTYSNAVGVLERKREPVSGGGSCRRLPRRRQQGRNVALQHPCGDQAAALQTPGSVCLL